ncbi:acyl-protein synthetase [Bowmanella denitrificans]|uniref:LuxE/PaaK family acyltransferase n=1 Tax=Bowmanella denitrificans TaxID=366582 RepID=UPI001FE8015C|nr:acyl-protein synthetase [Bowmanella denitrificans]
MDEEMKQYMDDMAVFEEKYEELLESPVYHFLQPEKERILLPLLSILHKHHSFRSQAYRLVDKLFKWDDSKALCNYPYLAVRLFKEFELKSISDDQVYKVLHSSGTTGQSSKIYLDKETAQLQTKVLTRILQHWLGKSRRPMLLIDSPHTVKKTGGMTARAAGLQGLSFFGRSHTYALDANMNLDIDKVSNFFEQFKGQSVLLFGFTFMVWHSFIQQLQKHNIYFELQDSILIHGGGWKKLQKASVSHQTFKQQIQTQLGDVRVHDYYGMVEQTGTIYMECEQGFFHCPVWSDIAIRNPVDLSFLPFQQVGLIQLTSVLARSYPGHCILTEDLGYIVGEDDCSCGLKGKYFKVSGRVPNAEVRGCSDTFS